MLPSLQKIKKKKILVPENVVAHKGSGKTEKYELRIHSEQQLLTSSHLQIDFPIHNLFCGKKKKKKSCYICKKHNFYTL